MVDRMNILWDYFVNQYGLDNQLIQLVQEFASVVLVLQDKTNDIINFYKDILHAVEVLTTCPYTSEAFSELLTKIQAAVSFFSLSSYDWYNSPMC